MIEAEANKSRRTKNIDSTCFMVECFLVGRVFLVIAVYVSSTSRHHHWGRVDVPDLITIPAGATDPPASTPECCRVLNACYVVCAHGIAST